MLIFDLQTIGDKLFAIRKRLGMTQNDVAAAAGLSDRTYADIERGSVNMRIETVMKICSALHITPDEVLTHTPEASAETDAAEILLRLQRYSNKQQSAAWQIVKTYLDSIDELSSPN